MQPVRHVRLAFHSCLICVALTLCLAGCEIFNGRSSGFQNAKKELPQLRPSADAMEFEVLYVERPVGDRLLGESLWEYVDQIVNLGAETQRNLERNGFRIGVAGSNPPEALQTLLGLKSDFAGASPSADAQPLSGKRIYLRSGMSTRIDVSPVYPECELTIFPSFSSEVGEFKRYETMQCVYYMTAHRVQEGWARLDFVPEVRYGNEKLRPSPGAQNWELVNSQKVERLHSQSFSVMLNLGEIALATARDSLPGTAGHRFFIGPDGADDIQRVLLVRLSHMGKPEVASAPSN